MNSIPADKTISLDRAKFGQASMPFIDPNLECARVAFDSFQILQLSPTNYAIDLKLADLSEYSIICKNDTVELNGKDRLWIVALAIEPLLRILHDGRLIREEMMAFKGCEGTKSLSYDIRLRIGAQKSISSRPSEEQKVEASLKDRHLRVILGSVSSDDLEKLGKVVSDFFRLTANKPTKERPEIESRHLSNIMRYFTSKLLRPRLSPDLLQRCKLILQADPSLLDRKCLELQEKNPFFWSTTTILDSIQILRGDTSEERVERVVKLLPTIPINKEIEKKKIFNDVTIMLLHKTPRLGLKMVQSPYMHQLSRDDKLLIYSRLVTCVLNKTLDRNVVKEVFNDINDEEIRKRVLNNI